MSGGKETPRQKMIGMMYLVLTALLALNVSNAVLEKFAILNTTLIQLTEEGSLTNEAKVAAILRSTSDNPKVKDAMAKAQQVRDLTKETMKVLEDVKTEITKDHAGVPIVGEELVTNTNVAEEKMLDARKPQLGQGYQKALEDYHTKLESISGIKFPKLAKKAEDYEEFKGNTTHKDKTFLEFSFENTPTMAAVTSITQMQTEVLEYEGVALDSLNAIAEGVQIKFDKTVPMVLGPTIVAAGAKYTGDMFISAASSGVAPEMFRNGAPLQVSTNPDGIKMGKVEFVAQASNYDANGMSKQSFKAEIRIAGKEPLVKVIEYMVAKPVIRVTTGNAPTLYQNCGNTVNIEVPALGSTYNPSFSAKGATIEKGDKPGRVTIIPKERKVSVTVSNGGAVIGTEPFDVKPIPKPRYVARENSGKEVDLKNGVRGAGLTGLRISADADDNFKQEVPKDANYRIKSMEIILARGTTRVATINATSELLDLGAWRSQFRPGDRISVDIKSVIRRTYTGEEEKVDIVGGTINIPIQ